MDPNPLGSAPPRRRRGADVIATAAMVAAGVALLAVVLVGDGIGSSAVTWSVLGALAIVLAGLGTVVVLRARRGRAHAGPDVGAPSAEPVIDLDEIDLDALDLDALDRSRIEVRLHPGPLWRRRLAERPDALVVVADAVALDVPGWIVEGRSRTIDRADRVVIPWGAIERFRVRAGSPGTYDITARPDAGPPGRWRVRRDEIGDEVALLDHVRRIGRITIELEDSISS